jgi:hypothetical protein
VIAIDNVLLSDQVIDEQFVCDLNKCKGACCIDGDAGAPLQKNELKIIDKLVPKVKHLLSKEALEIIATEGHYVTDPDFEWVTPTVGNGICVYGIIDENGWVKCSFEHIYNQGHTDWKKPISCHLYPLIVTQGKQSELVNYEPRETHCAPACKLGKKQKVPVYQFLKEPIIRKFGTEFYDALDAVAKHKSEKKKKP